MNLGKICLYEVIRETNLGYIISNNGEEYFLHHNECNGEKFIPGDKVKAFLYVDKKNRPSATLFNPLITINQTRLLQVVDVNEKLGVFFNIGISKDILMSTDDLPKDIKSWPKKGDYIPCNLYIRANRLVLKIANKNDILATSLKDVKLNKNEITKGYVYRKTVEGINFVTSDYEVIFVYKTNYRKEYRLGEEEEIEIIDIHDNDYSGKIIRNKEMQIENDYNIILKYLLDNNGVMMINDKSSPELIYKLFNMSKTSFKNAIGKLLKEGKIEIINNKIVLKD